MKPILITGANGFLGSHLADFYLKQDTEIYGISHGLSKFSKVNQIHDDILTAEISPNDVSTILHFAALTDIQYCENNPSECYKINVEGTKNILELARKNDSNLIFASSSHVYGKPNSLPILETDPLNPISIHGKSKVKAEDLCEKYAKLYGMNIIIVRTFSIYGSKSPSYSITSRIINQILNNQKITLGNLKTKRDFLHISDFLSAIDILIKTNLNGCSKFNIGYGKSFSINEICNKLLTIAGISIPIESDLNLIRDKDIDELVCNNSKLKELGWSPNLSLDDGLEQVFDWFKKNSEN